LARTNTHTPPPLYPSPFPPLPSLPPLPPPLQWHRTYPHGLPNTHNVQIEGWTGYSVYEPLFPTLRAFFERLRRRGIYVNLNMHPAAGVEFHEDAYPAMARAVGLDPSTGATVAFDPANQTYMAALFEHVLKPLDDLGLDYWWIDFQHGPFTPVPVLNPTIALNLAWWTNPWRYGHRTDPTLAGANGSPGGRGRDRPFIMGRWGGLGGHRYPVGFAGDTAVRWKVLRYETYFSPTASNVGFMWTHDIGGFEGDPPPELLTRWVQWGTVSAMLRTHSSKLSPARSAWHYPNPYLSVMRTFYRLRAALLPFLATAQRVSVDTGVQMLRPMYYHFPYSPAAYADQGLHQHFFGSPDTWAAPIAAKVNDDGTPLMSGSAPLANNALRTGQTGRTFDRTKSQAHGLVPWTVWVPPGDWIEWFSWQAVSGSEAPASGPGVSGLPTPPPGTPGAGAGSYVRRNYTLAEMPLFSAPGTIVPLRNLPGAGSASSVLGLATQPVDDLAVWVFPLTPASGLGSSSSAVVRRTARLYDDDGLSIDYQDGGFHWTTLACEWERGTEGGEAESGGVGAAIASFFSSSSGGGSAAAAADQTADGGDTLTCTVSAPDGGDGYPSFPSARAYTWRLVGTWPPARVTFDGEEVGRDQAGGPDNSGEHSAWREGQNAWAFHGASLSTYVRIGRKASTSSAHTLRLSFGPGARLDDPLLTGGLARKVQRGLVCKDDVDRHYGLVHPVDVEPVLRVIAAATRLSSSASAADARAILARVDPDIAEGRRIVGLWGIPPTHTVALTLQAHCTGALADASEGASLRALGPDEAAYKKADAAIKFTSDIANSKGSAPGQVSQYSGTDEEEGEGEEGLAGAAEGGGKGMAEAKVEATP
jgi:hypothetical protein